MDLKTTTKALDGWCRYGNNDTDWMQELVVADVDACRQACRSQQDCTAYSWEEGDSTSPCDLYRGGPYTHGNGRANTTCYILPATITNASVSEMHHFHRIAISNSWQLPVASCQLAAASRQPAGRRHLPEGSWQPAVHLE